MNPWGMDENLGETDIIILFHIFSESIAVKLLQGK